MKNPLISDARIQENSIDYDAANGTNSSGDKIDEKTGFVINIEAEELADNLKMLDSDDDSDSDDNNVFGEQRGQFDDSSESSSSDDDDDNEDDEKNGDNKKPKKPKKQLKVQKHTISFQIESSKAEIVKKAALDMDYPLMDEYDFKNDTMNENIPMELKTETRIRRYQERR
mgnify:FL=1